MDTKVTRRDLGAALFGAATAFAQSPSQKTPAEELRSESDDTAANGKKLEAFAVPMAVEPAFSFKA